MVEVEVFTSLFATLVPALGLTEITLRGKIPSPC